MKTYETFKQFYEDYRASSGAKDLRVGNLGLVDVKWISEMPGVSLVACIHAIDESRANLSIFDQRLYDEAGRIRPSSVFTEKTKPKQITGYRLDNSNISRHPIEIIAGEEQR